MSRMNILVATPGRLLQHMDQTLGFDCDHLQILGTHEACQNLFSKLSLMLSWTVLDEADRILDMGFSSCVNAIVANLPKTRQTLLFSATQTKSVKDLARLSLHDPEYVAVREAGTSASVKGKGKQEDGEEPDATPETPKNLEQHYMVVPLEEKLDVLWSFIKTHLFTKTIVFLSSGKQVRTSLPARPTVAHNRLAGPLRVREFPTYATWCATPAHAREAKTDATTRDLSAFLGGQAFHLVCNGYRCARLGFPIDRLGGAGRLPGRRGNVHSPCRANGTLREQGQGVVVPAAVRGTRHGQAAAGQEGRD